MGLAEDDERLVADLQSSWTSHDSDSGLNQHLRNSLRSFAKKEDLLFQQDNAGNIYILRRGLDSSLSSIALAFPLDSLSPPSSFQSALRTFLQLNATRTMTDVTLLGFTSPSNSKIGYDLWEGTDDASTLFDSYPALKDFSGYSDPDQFAICALLEIQESVQSPLAVSGSPLLADQARTMINVEMEVTQGQPQSTRCAASSLQGKDAISVAVAVVVAYGEYVKKLFDNFD